MLDNLIKVKMQSGVKERTKTFKGEDRFRKEGEWEQKKL